MSNSSRDTNNGASSDFCPYVGLAPFEDAHFDYFFGRDLDAATLADSLLAAPLTILYGASGVGKSSLLNVGLRKALQHLGQEAISIVFRRWQSEDVSSELRSTISQEISLDAEMLSFQLLDQAAAFSQFTLWAAQRVEMPLLLMLDQFEEYFLYHKADKAKRFEEELGALIYNEDTDVHVVIAIREDRYHLLERLRLTIPDVLDNTLELTHLDKDAVSEAIRRPVEVYNQRFRQQEEKLVVEPNFVDRLIHELRHVEGSSGRDQENGRIELAYLQLALKKIWKAAGGGKAKTLESEILRERTVPMYVRDHLEAIMEGLSDEEKALCARIFDHLVTPVGAKIALSAEELSGYGDVDADEEGVEAVLEKLSRGDARIVTPVFQAGRNNAYEIFHDVLCAPVLEWKKSFDEARRIEKEVRVSTWQLRDKVKTLWNSVGRLIDDDPQKRIAALKAFSAALGEESRGLIAHIADSDSKEQVRNAATQSLRTLDLKNIVPNHYQLYHLYLLYEGENDPHQVPYKRQGNVVNELRALRKKGLIETREGHTIAGMPQELRDLRQLVKLTPFGREYVEERETHRLENPRRKQNPKFWSPDRKLRQ